MYHCPHEQLMTNAEWSDTCAGAGAGAGIGSAIGGPPGAIVGSIIGGITGYEIGEHNK